MQEVGVRIIDRSVPFVSLDDLLPWCLTVARNLHVDVCRRAARFGDIDDVPEQRSLADVSDIVESRDLLARVMGSYYRLKESDQQALTLSPSVEKRSRQEAVKHNVRRLRARQRLMRLVEAGVTAVCGAFALRSRSWRPMGGTAALVPVVLALSIASGYAPGDDGSTPLVRYEHEDVAGPGGAVDDLAGRPGDVALARPFAPAPAAQEEPGVAGSVTPAALEVNPVGGMPIARVILRDRGQEDSDVCLKRLVLLGDVCVGHGGARPAAAVGAPSRSAQDVPQAAPTAESMPSGGAPAP